MPKKLIWTDAQDTQIRRLRMEGASWDMIATILGLARWTTIERGRHIGARPPPGSSSRHRRIRLAIRCQRDIHGRGVC